MRIWDHESYRMYKATMLYADMQTNLSSDCQKKMVTEKYINLKHYKNEVI